MAFNNFAQQTNSLKSRVEKHILSDFEGFKTKMKLELSKKANEKRPEEELNVDEVHQLKNRITSLEQKYHDMFMEEGLDESDDYDSQEEMDNMMDDIDRAALRERGDSDEQINDGDPENEEFSVNKGEISGTPTTQNSDLIKSIPTPFTSPPNFTPESISPPIVETVKEETKEISVETSIPNKVSDSEPIINKIEKKEEIKIVQNEVAQPELPQKDKTISDFPKESSAKQVEITEEKPTELKSKLDISIVSEENAAKPTPKVPIKSTIEVDNPEQLVPKHTRKGGSSRNDNQTLSRKNSMVSSRSGTNQGGGPNNLRQVNKKISALQKELEGYKLALDESKQTILEYQEELAKAYEKISEVRMECKEVEEKRQGMELSFIKALRRAGIDKKNKSKIPAVANLNAEQMNKIKKQIDEKSKKIISMSTYVEKIAADTMHIKDTQQNRINEIITYVKYLDEARLSLTKEFSSMLGVVKQLEGDLKINIENVQKDVISIQGPIIDLISEQQRENQMLNEDIKNHQNMINNVIEDFSSKAIYTPKENIRKKISGVHPSTASPDLSVKYKLTSAKNGNRRTSAKTCDN